MTQHSEYQEVTFKSKDFEERHREQYKRDMMLQLVTNEALSCSSVTHDNGELQQYVRTISRIADKLTEEAFKRVTTS